MHLLSTCPACAHPQVPGDFSRKALADVVPPGGAASKWGAGSSGHGSSLPGEDGLGDLDGDVEY